MSEQEILSDIRERVVRVETKLDNMKDVQDEVKEVNKTANRAMESSKSAHKRLNKIDKAILFNRLCADFELSIALFAVLFTSFTSSCTSFILSNFVSTLTTLSLISDKISCSLIVNPLKYNLFELLSEL